MAALASAAARMVISSRALSRPRYGTLPSITAGFGPRRVLALGSGRLVLLLLAFLLVMTGCFGGGNLIGWGDGWSATAVRDGVLYVATRDGSVLAYDVSDPRRQPDLIWSFELEGDGRLGGFFGGPAVGDGYVYVADQGDGDGKNGSIVALSKNRDDWDLPVKEGGAWQRPLTDGGGVVGSPALGGSLVLIGSDDGNLYAYRTTGDKLSTLAWKFRTDGRIWSTPVVRDGVVYFGSMDRYVYALSLEEGLNDEASRLLWKYKTGGAVVATPLLLDDLVVVGSFDRKLYALRAGTANPNGELAWAEPFDGSDWFWAGAIADEDYIYAATMDGTVYALDREGSPVWASPFKAESGPPIVSTPIIVDDKIVVGTDIGTLYLLSSTDGVSVRNPLSLDGPIKAPLSKQGSTVFVGLENGVVQAVNVDADLEDMDPAWRIPRGE